MNLADVCEALKRVDVGELQGAEKAVGAALKARALAKDQFTEGQVVEVLYSVKEGTRYTGEVISAKGSQVKVRFDVDGEESSFPALQVQPLPEGKARDAATAEDSEEGDEEAGDTDEDEPAATKTKTETKAEKPSGKKRLVDLAGA